MPSLFGKKYTKEDIRKYFGSLEQIGGIKIFTYADGRANGLRAVEVRTGSGLSFIVLLDRGMDIGTVEYKGMPLSFRSAVGESNPHFFEAVGKGWLRNFGGGLLVTCGITYLGSPTIENGEELGLHGRISNIPAELISTNTEWIENECIFTISGRVRETAMFGPNLVLQRKITAKLGEDRFFITDRVTNEGFKPEPLMILYHFNIGHPVLDKGSEFAAASKEVRPRDEIAKKYLSNYKIYDRPTSDFPDVVFYHDLISDDNDWCQAAIINNNLNIGVYIRYQKKNLPNFIQWKYTSEGEYVAGLEPANCLVEGRTKERERGTLQYILPGESKEYQLEIGVLSAKNEIKKFQTQIKSLINYQY